MAVIAVTHALMVKGGHPCPGGSPACVHTAGTARIYTVVTPTNLGATTYSAQK